MNKNGIMVMLGTLVGLSTAIAVVILSDKRLKKEAQEQVSSLLTSTKKIVRHVRDASVEIAPEQYQNSSEESDKDWEKTINLAEQHLSASEIK